MATSSSLTGIRGPLLHFIADPFYIPLSESLRYLPDGLLVIQNGKILDVGPYATLAGRYADLPVTHHPQQLIVPGLIDTHIHFPQTEMIAAYGEQLLTWLERYTFPTEQKFNDRTYALTVAHHFLDQLLRHGTTTALVFTSVYPQSTDAFFEAAQTRNLRMIAGKVLMDRHAPAPLLDTPETAYQQSKALIEKWHKKDRLLYAVTPRFAITSTPEQLTVAGQLLRDFPDTYLHTHLAENLDEITWTQRLFPDCASYLDVYTQAGLVGPRSIFAHGIYLDDRDRTTLSTHHCAIAHCPSSNLFLGSGLFSLAAAKDPAQPIKIGLGTDIGGGTSFSLLHTAGEAYKVAQLQRQTLTPFQALFLATLGGAQALSLAAAKDPAQPIKIGLGTDIGGGTSFSLLHTAGEAYKVAQLQRQTLTPFQALFLATLGGAQALSLDALLGNFTPGKEADFIVLDPQATPTLAFRNQALMHTFSTP
ncbi:MAG: guanine deaminase, partial [Cyanobacteria bacterium J06607_13]